MGNSDGAALQSMQSGEQSAEESDQVNEVNDAATVEQSMQPLQSANKSVEADGDLNMASGDAVGGNSDGAELHLMQSGDQSAEEGDQVNEVNDDATEEQSMQSEGQSAEESDQVNEVDDDAS